MKPLKIGLLATIVLVSCSSTQVVSTTTSSTTSTTTSTSTTTPPKTVAPIDYGSDCETVTYDEIIRLAAVIDFAQGKLEEDRNKSRSKMVTAHYAVMESYRNLRSYIRKLDIPLLSREQRNWVDAIQDYVDGLNRYLESDGLDLSVNNSLIPLNDAMTDFVDAFWEFCPSNPWVKIE
jgi:hypothetical protein